MKNLNCISSICSIFFIFHVHANEPSFNEKLTMAIAKAPPEWMLQQIEEDLSLYKENGISKESLDRLMTIASNEMLVRFKIVDNQVTYTINEAYLINFPEHADFFNTRLKAVVDPIKRLVSIIPLLNVDFIITVNDCAYNRNDLSLAPIFVFAKNKYYTTHILFPDSDALYNYHNVENSIIDASKKSPWENKLNKVFWRGSTTDGWYDVDHWRMWPRALLVLLSLKQPELIDAKFSNLIPVADTNHEMVSMPEIMSDYVAPSDSLHYKYLLQIDGVTCSSHRFYWTLLSNCVVFKQVTDNIEWYYRGLSPNYHYVPIAKDMSDLLEKIDYAKNHDLQMQQMAKNGTQFAKEDLSQEMIYLYIYLLLTNYAGLLK